MVGCTRAWGTYFMGLTSGYKKGALGLCVPFLKPYPVAKLHMSQFITSYAWCLKPNRVHCFLGEVRTTIHEKPCSRKHSYKLMLESMGVKDELISSWSIGHDGG